MATTTPSTDAKKDAPAAPAADKTKTTAYCWEKAALAIRTAARLGRHVLLWGPPGSGKTRAAQSVGVPGQEIVCYTKTLTDDMGAYELRGFERLVEGNFSFSEGPVIAAWRLGCRLVLNEIEKTSGDVTTFLLAALDGIDVASEILPDGRVIRPRPGYHVVATSNCEDLGEIHPALMDRFAFVVKIDRIHPDALNALSIKRLRDIAAASFSKRDPAERVSIRSWIAFNEAIAIGTRVEDAAAIVFGDRAKDILGGLKVAGMKIRADGTLDAEEIEASKSVATAVDPAVSETAAKIAGLIAKAASEPRKAGVADARA